MINKLKIIYRNILRQRRIANYLKKGMKPWDVGYEDYKMQLIEQKINDDSLIDSFANNNIPATYGLRIDERVVEYPWIIANLRRAKSELLDAGSTFNFEYLLNHKYISQKNVSILTLFPEADCFFDKGVSYHYGDIRDTVFKDNCFDEIVCQSTLEHIDMNNDIYEGKKMSINNTKSKSYEYLNAIKELQRILKQDGLLLLTFPYGRFENHAFFQQFDKEMVGRMEEYLNKYGTIQKTYFKYNKTGWTFASEEDCADAESYNPHTKIGLKDDNAAHSRAVCCIKFIKNNGI